MEGRLGSESGEDEVRRMARRVRGVFGGGECMTGFQLGPSRQGRWWNVCMTVVVCW